jgi:hypothetical protein
MAFDPAFNQSKPGPVASHESTSAFHFFKHSMGVSDECARTNDKNVKIMIDMRGKGIYWVQRLVKHQEYIY